MREDDKGEGGRGIHIFGYGLWPVKYTKKEAGNGWGQKW